MDYPMFRKEILPLGRKYFAHFRDFSYSLEIIKQQGFIISLIDDQIRFTGDEVCDSSEVKRIIHSVLRWMNHTKSSKIDPNASDFCFYSFGDKRGSTTCGFNRNEKFVLLCKPSCRVGNKLERSVILVNGVEKVSDLTKGSKKSYSAMDVEIKKWQFYRSWEPIQEVVKAMQIDIHRFEGKIGSKKMINGNDKIFLIRKCQENRIPVDTIVHESRCGLNIAGNLFFDKICATKYVDAILGERSNRLEPAFNLYSDKLIAS